MFTVLLKLCLLVVEVLEVVVVIAAVAEEFVGLNFVSSGEKKRCGSKKTFLLHFTFLLMFCSVVLLFRSSAHIWITSSISGPYSARLWIDFFNFLVHCHTCPVAVLKLPGLWSVSTKPHFWPHMKNALLHLFVHWHIALHVTPVQRRHMGQSFVCLPAFGSVFSGAHSPHMPSSYHSRVPRVQLFYSQISVYIDTHFPWCCFSRGRAVMVWNKPCFWVRVKLWPGLQPFDPSWGASGLGHVWTATCWDRLTLDTLFRARWTPQRGG